LFGVPNRNTLLQPFRIAFGQCSIVFLFGKFINKESSMKRSGKR